MKRTTANIFRTGASTNARRERKTPARIAQAAGEMFDALESRRLLIAGPSLSSTYLSPATVPFLGQPVTIYPIAANAFNGTIAQVRFYYDTNDDGILQQDWTAPNHDLLIGIDNSGADGWSATVATQPGLGFHTGANRVFAQVVDNRGFSASRPAILTITAANQVPTIGGFAASPNPVTRAGSTTLTASGLADADGTVSSVEFYLGAGGDGTFQAPVSYGVGSSPYSVAVGDFNGDGQADLATANTGDGVSILLGNANGTFQTAVSYGAGSTPYTVAIGDFNGDGRADVAAANANSNNVSILLGNGDGTFQAAVNYAVGSNPRFVAVGDFNSDGRPDLAVANKFGNSVSILMADLDGAFQPAVDIPVGASPRSITVGDFNGDHRPDMAVINVSDSNVSILLGNGNGTFQTPVNYAVGANPYYITSGDLNGDGRPDLAVANETSSNVSVLLGNASGTFQNAVNWSTGSLPRSVSIADFNGDGKPDLVVTNKNSNSISLLRGNGDGTFQLAVNLAVGSGPQTVAVADFNHDGTPDLAVSIANTSSVSILLGNTAFLPGHDRLLGTASVVGGQAVLNISTAGLPAGPVTIFARAKDNRNASGAISSTILTVADRNPTIASFTATPNPVVLLGNSLNLSAGGVADPDGTVAHVRFYRAADSTDTTLNLATARLLGQDSLAAGGYTLAVNTGINAFGFSPGINRLFAVVTDSDGRTAVRTTTVRINARPVIGSISTSAITVDRGGALSVTASSVIDGVEAPAFAGTISAVQFYLDLNLNGAIDATDRFLGAGVRQTGTSNYRLTFASTGFPLGPSIVLARATDNNAATSAIAVAMFDVANANPTFAAVAITPGTAAFVGRPITLAAQAAADSDGTVRQARFYYDSNNDGILQDDQSAMPHDLLLGTDLSAAGGWSLGLSAQPSLGFGVGANRVWIQLQDNDGGLLARSAILNITAANAVPVVGSLIGPNIPTPRGGTATFTASGVSDADGTAAAVEFYLSRGGNGTFQPPSNTAVGALPYAVAAGDFNGDGLIDMAVANSFSNNVSVLLRNSGGSFDAAVNYAAGTGPISVAVGDFNADGLPDLALANSGSGDVSVLLGAGGGVFSAAVNYAASSGPVTVAVGDFNADGYSDLAVANFSNTVSILLGNGNGTFAARVNYATGSGPQGLAVGDLNGDGRPDLAVTNSNSDNVSILLGNADGTFRPRVDYNVGDFPVSVAIGDFNGDGRADLATADVGTSTVTVLFGNGAGVFAAGGRYSAGPTPYAIAAGDFNGDGRIDLATANIYGASVAVLLGVPGGSFARTAYYGAGDQPRGIAIADFNGDGAQDIATANYNGDDISVLLGNSELVLGRDRLLGAAAVVGGNATLTFSTAGLTAGPVTVFARARDNRSAFGDARPAVLTVGNRAPTIAAVTAAPNPSLALGGTLNLSATGVADADGTIARVRFYRAADAANATFDLTTAIQLGNDVSAAGGYTRAVNTANGALGFTLGLNRIFAVAIDNEGAMSVAATTTVRFNTSPTIGSFNLTTPASLPILRSTTFTLTLAGVTDDTSVTSINLYRDSSGNGALSATDILLGAATRVGTSSTWTFTRAGSSLVVGTYKLFARATDSNGATAVAQLLVTVI